VNQTLLLAERAGSTASGGQATRLTRHQIRARIPARLGNNPEGAEPPRTPECQF